MTTGWIKRYHHCRQSGSMRAFYQVIENHLVTAVNTIK